MAVGLTHRVRPKGQNTPKSENRIDRNGRMELNDAVPMSQFAIRANIRGFHNVRNMFVVTAVGAPIYIQLLTYSAPESRQYEYDENALHRNRIWEEPLSTSPAPHTDYFETMP